MKAVGRDGNAEFVSVERVTIGGKDWVEGVLIDSEVFNYETTYLATNTADAAILITFSVHKKFRAVRSEVLRRMMQSLVVYQRAS
jgi:hypothetical protein